MATDYAVKKSLRGALRVHFRCPKCAATVNFDLEDAGTGATCPACGVSVVVPGTVELEAERNKAKVLKAETERKAESERKVEEQRARQSQEQLAALQASQTEAARNARLRPKTATMNGWGTTMLVLGVVLFPIAVVFADRPLLPWVLAGFADSCIFFGVLCKAAGLIGAEVNRWGRDITERLDRDAEQSRDTSGR